MFFIFGINNGTRELNYHDTVICGSCGSYGRYQVYMTYMCFSLFFIPIFRWNRRYFVRMSCCDTVYALNPECGRKIRRGEQTTITEGDLSLVQPGRPGWNRVSSSCPNCGADLEESYQFCPHCGYRLTDKGKETQL